MRANTIVRIAAFIWCVGHPLLAESSPPEPGTLVTRYFAAWNAHAPEAFAKLFAPDADWVTASGSRIHGRENIRAYLSEEHAGWAKHTRMKCFNVLVRSVNSGTANIFFEWEISGTAEGDAATPARRGNILLVATSSGPDSDWTIVAGQVARRSEPR